jgi:hypothetical protein
MLPPGFAGVCGRFQVSPRQIRRCTLISIKEPSDQLHFGSDVAGKGIVALIVLRQIGIAQFQIDRTLDEKLGLPLRSGGNLSPASTAVRCHRQQIKVS